MQSFAVPTLIIKENQPHQITIIDFRNNSRRVP